MVFKKVKMVDNAKAVLNFEKSPLKQLFNRTRDKMELAGEGIYLCLFAVAGDHTVVLTNLTTNRVPGLVHLYQAGMWDSPDIHLISYTDLPKRLPTLFNHEEN